MVVVVVEVVVAFSAHGWSDDEHAGRAGGRAGKREEVSFCLFLFFGMFFVFAVCLFDC